MFTQLLVTMIIRYLPIFGDNIRLVQNVPFATYFKLKQLFIMLGHSKVCWLYLVNAYELPCASRCNQL